MLLLGLDTATPAVTVAVHDGEQPLAQLVSVDAHRHAELVTPGIAEVIADAGVTREDLTGIAVGVGPGPYTGLRVGLVTAKVLGAALGIPVYGVCTLDVIAADVQRGAFRGNGKGFLVATDARRRELYWAEYDAAGNRVAGPTVSAPADIPEPDRPVAGEGALLYPDVLRSSVAPSYPAAASLCRVAATALRGRASGNSVSGNSAPRNSAPGNTGDEGKLLPPEPLYLRRPDAREPHAPKRVSQA